MPTVEVMWVVTAIAASVSSFLAAAADQPPPMTFNIATSDRAAILQCAGQVRLHGNCTWIAADGLITNHTAADLQKFVATNKIDPSGEWLVINSPGGDLDGAIQLGELIQTLKLNVRVGDTVSNPRGSSADNLKVQTGGVCLSACVFALMGGVEREVSDNDSKVGVHQFHPEDDRASSDAVTYSKAQSEIAKLYDYTRRMGVNTALIGLLFETPGVQYLSIKQMENTRLLTTRSDPDPADWVLTSKGRSLAAIAMQDQKSGSQVKYSLDCKTFQVEIPLQHFTSKSASADEIARSISKGEPDVKWAGARPVGEITSENSDHIYRGLKLLSAVGDILTVRVSYSSSASLIDLIANSREPLQLALPFDLPEAYEYELGGRTHRLPTSNLGEMAQVLERGCTKSGSHHVARVTRQ